MIYNNCCLSDIRKDDNDFLNANCMRLNIAIFNHLEKRNSIVGHVDIYNVMFSVVVGQCCGCLLEYSISTSTGHLFGPASVVQVSRNPVL